MNIYYHPEYNISLGIFNFLHPFDGTKFSKVYKKILNLEGIQIKQPHKPVSREAINGFVDVLVKELILNKRYILKALEIPYIPLLPFSVIDKRILLPMRWGVSGTLEATRDALQGNMCWNMSGGYHHARRSASEGFCIYNDIGITVQELEKQGLITDKSRLLIVDIDAHHGNGNAYTFMDDNRVTILDIYNGDIYPQNPHPKSRININIPLYRGVSGEVYLNKLSEGLDELNSEFDLAFVVAGTDVIMTDPLGGMHLTIDECIARDKMVFNKLKSLSAPTVFLGGGGYSSDSATAITGSISALYKS